MNLNCSVIGARTELDLSRLIDPAGRRAVPEVTAMRAVWFLSLIHI